MSNVLAQILKERLSKMLEAYLYLDTTEWDVGRSGLATAKVQLENVKVKPSALDRFNLPFRLKSGSVG